MFRIRRIQDTTSPKNAAAIQRVQEIMRTQISKTPPEFVAGVPDMLTDPLKLPLQRRSCSSPRTRTTGSRGSPCCCTRRT